MQDVKLLIKMLDKWLDNIKVNSFDTLTSEEQKAIVGLESVLTEMKENKLFGVR